MIRVKQCLEILSLIKKLKDYDRDGINKETIELLQPYYNLKDDWFNEKNAINASKAIYKYRMTIYDYHDKSKIVKPKKENLVIYAFISYCGPFNSDFIAQLSNDYFVADMKKRGIPVTPNLELLSFRVDDATIGEWNLQGLPKDDLSIQNSIMVTNFTRYPLLIDPQGHGL